ncbi:NACHT domain-containing protein [Mycena venus]|uniref:NACHT domain-containing protein n=1 Tax=Mycena venus TaxID=2733690 RepID=A0A8H7DFD4_9AGAR|nr:NACHT domain-containing protein [Mycena venus]
MTTLTSSPIEALSVQCFSGNVPDMCDVLERFLSLSIAHGPVFYDKLVCIDVVVSSMEGDDGEEPCMPQSGCRTFAFVAGGGWSFVEFPCGHDCICVHCPKDNSLSPLPQGCTMPFTINGAISGSTFNNVGGDMNQITGDLTQIFNSHGHHPSTASAGQIVGRRGRNALTQPTAIDDQSVGVIRTQRKVPRQHSQPYDAANYRYPHIGEELENPHQDSSLQNNVDTLSDGTGTDAMARDELPQHASTMEEDIMRRRLLQQGEIIPANTYHVGGNMTQLTLYGEPALDILYRFIAMGATHDSGERFAEPACHPGTRIAVLEQLSAWADDTRPESSIL